MTIMERFDAWLKWQDVKKWAEGLYPGWLYLATQEKRPELRELYKQRLIEAYEQDVEYT